MDIEKTISIYIDIEEIIEDNNLTHTSSWQEVERAVQDYVLGLDDSDYYLIDDGDIKTICTAVGNQIFTEEDNNAEN